MKQFTGSRISEMVNRRTAPAQETDAQWKGKSHLKFLVNCIVLQTYVEAIHVVLANPISLRLKIHAFSRISKLFASIKRF
ncbi:hypothetical protein AZI98_06095 [Aeribacillus pallidus]|uniref:Uncharacterized protein n=1 Tax=Aeribacillus pallidus TaxID=33936 RepID=A0A161ZV10_9BACI|nr:hypothetical protein AZI98_06095 [Aeribacillus pallidus]